MARYIHHFTVTGTREFPIDMLRYDGAFPDKEVDSGRIHESVAHGFMDGDCKIHLIAVRGLKIWRPTEGRWKSFLWTVVPDSHRVERADR